MHGTKARVRPILRCVNSLTLLVPCIVSIVQASGVGRSQVSWAYPKIEMNFCAPHLPFMHELSEQAELLEDSRTC